MMYKHYLLRDNTFRPFELALEPLKSGADMLITIAILLCPSPHWKIFPMQIAISNIADKFKLKFKRLLYDLGPEVIPLTPTTDLYLKSRKSLLSPDTSKSLNRECNRNCTHCEGSSNQQDRSSNLKVL